ncbi:MAK10-like protein [Tanacetum coccineum]
MGDENPIRTLGDYSRPNHEGYQNTIDLPVGNNVVPLRSDTIRTAKLRNDILMFQQHQVNISLKHGLDSRTYSKNSLIMASIFGSKSKSFMTMSIPPQGESSIKRLVPGEKGIVKSGTKDDDRDTIVKIKEEFPPSSNAEFVCTKETDEDIMFIEIIKKNDDSCEGELGEDESVVTGELEVEYFDGLPTRSELAYHKYLMCAPIPSLFLRNPIIVRGCPLNLKIPCNIGHVYVEKVYLDLNSSLNVMTRMQYNWIMRKQLKPREDPGGISGISNLIGRINGMHIFLGNFTYISDFIVIEDISSIIDPRLSQVVLGKPFVEIFNMTHDLSLGVVKFTDGTNEIAYKMPYKIEQYNSISDLEKRAHEVGLLKERGGHEKRSRVRDEQDIRVL